ncbi:MAG: hypothetical protein KDK65_00080 [Chlamydiia bacterium]|nr:hypothetical protein [Chlamydiia bacterium]
MNILIFVFSLLLILSFLSYGRLENYSTFTLASREWKEQMIEQERAALFDRVKELYQEETVQTKEGGGEQDQVQASSKIPLKAFANAPDSVNRTTYQLLLKNLMAILFQNNPYFRNAAINRPDYPEAIIQELIEPKDLQGNPLKVQRVSDLAILYWKDPQLKEIFYHMIKESPTGLPVVEINDDGIDSLLNYFNTKSAEKIRLYLAPRNLLWAIYGSQAVANDIINYREKLYTEVKSGYKDHPTASQEFENIYGGGLVLQFTYILDFQVNETNPRSYR